MIGRPFFRMITIVIGLLFCFAVLIGCKNGTTSIESNEDHIAEANGFDSNIKPIEDHIAKANGFDRFTINTIDVTVVDSPEHISHLSVDGVKTENGVEEQWSNMYSISYEAFLTLYQINDYWYLYDSQNQYSDVPPKPLDIDTIELIISCLNNSK